MLGVVKVLSGVFVLRRIATAHVAALHAKAQMDPLIAHFEALLAALRRFWFDVMNVIRWLQAFIFSILQLLIEANAARKLLAS